MIGGVIAVCVAALGGLAIALLSHNVAGAHLTKQRLPLVLRLRMGECINSAQNAATAVHVVPCSQPHDAEIFATFQLAGQRWPGSAAVGTRARAGCTARLGSYLNPQIAAAVLAQFYIYPSGGSWAAGERTVICEIRNTQGKLTGSVRGLSF